MNKKPFPSTKYPFKNLVFQGGGVKAYAYHGVLPVLEEHGVLKQIERVGGASAGAAQAALLSFRLDAERTIELYKTIDFSKITSPGAIEKPELQGDRPMKSQIGKLRGDLKSFERFTNRFGRYSNEIILEWLQQTIAHHCEGNPRATFSDFRALGFRDLYILVVNVSRHRPEIFSAETTPQVAVADAVMMSMTIPFYFEAMRFDGKSIGQGDYYIDGGVLSNYPLTIFDQPKYKQASRHFTFGVNWETLGCRLFTPPETAQHKAPITNIFNFAENVAATFGEMGNIAIEQRTVDQLRSIYISNCGVSTVDFEIKPEMHDQKYSRLVAAGESATRAYLENYRLPSDWFANLKGKMDDYLKFQP